MRVTPTKFNTYQTAAEMREAYAAIRAAFYKPPTIEEVEQARDVVIDVPVEPPPEPVKTKSITTLIRYKHAPTKQHEEIQVESPEPPPTYPSIDLIMMATGCHFSLSKLELISDRRVKRLIRARHIAMYLCRKLTVRSHPYIGRRFAGRDHTSILHAVKKIEKLVADGDKEYINDISVIEKLILGAYETA